MRHSRADYDLIQDGRPEAERIPDDEPVFVLRSKDYLAPGVIDDWGDRLVQQGGDSGTAELAYGWAEEMRIYAREHYDGGKLPDAPTALDSLEGGTNVDVISNRPPAESDLSPESIENQLEEQTAKELYDIAKERDVPGRSHMSKAELVEELSGEKPRLQVLVEAVEAYFETLYSGRPLHSIASAGKANEAALARAAIAAASE